MKDDIENKDNLISRLGHKVSLLFNSSNGINRYKPSIAKDLLDTKLFEETDFKDVLLKYVPVPITPISKK